MGLVSSVHISIGVAFPHNRTTPKPAFHIVSYNWCYDEYHRMKLLWDLPFIHNPAITSSNGRRESFCPIYQLFLGYDSKKAWIMFEDYHSPTTSTSLDICIRLLICFIRSLMSHPFEPCPHHSHFFHLSVPWCHWQDGWWIKNQALLLGKRHTSEFIPFIECLSYQQVLLTP